MAIGKIGKSMGDSGTFGSRATMNAIGKMQAKKRTAKPFTPAGNSMAKGMLTGRGIKSSLKSAASKMFGGR